MSFSEKLKNRPSVFYFVNGLSTVNGYQMKVWLVTQNGGVSVGHKKKSSYIWDRKLS